LAQEGITREVSAPYSEEQNGISERFNRTVLDRARSILKRSMMPTMLLAEDVATAVNIKHRLLTRALPNSTPFERWPGQDPEISHVHTVGCLAFAWIHGELRRSSILTPTNVSLLEFRQRDRCSIVLWISLQAEASWPGISN
jgi:hypothetical protein